MPSGDLDEVVAAVLGERRCPGAVVTVARDGAHRTFAVGSEACDSARPTDAGGLFEIGSITKVLVATLVLQHVARGDIELDDPVHARIPEFRLALRFWSHLTADPRSVSLRFSVYSRRSRAPSPCSPTAPAPAR